MSLSKSLIRFPKTGDFQYSSAYTDSYLGGQKGEQTVDYLYDNNGNITLDKNKDITSIIYNHLNLPCVITIAGKEPSPIFTMQ